MNNMAPINFEALVTKTNSAAAKPTGLDRVRSFSKIGIEEVEKCLKRVRMNGSFQKQEIEDLLIDPQFSKETKETFFISREKVFENKKALCDYFIHLFGEPFLLANRKNDGLWTWLALAYYRQFVRTKRNASVLAAEASWVFKPGNYRLSCRHFTAGPVYLALAFQTTGADVKDLLFSSPVSEFGGFIDAITYIPTVSRVPALMQVAAWLYYDPRSAKRFKKGAIEQDKPGTIRQFLRVASQLAQTRDFYSVEDAHELWSLLPRQFDEFKGEAEH